MRAHTISRVSTCTRRSKSLVKPAQLLLLMTTLNAPTVSTRHKHTCTPSMLWVLLVNCVCHGGYILPGVNVRTNVFIIGIVYA
jgi:hypothetical protein